MNEQTARQNVAKRAGRGGSPPPEHTKWKKGCPSPNPSGRRSLRVISDAVKAVLAEVDSKSQRSNAEQLARQLVQRAKQGSVKHLALVLAYAEGRPPQKVSISGGVFHAHADWRPLAALSDEEVNQLDVLTRKLLGPGEERAIDVPVESNGA